MRIGDIDLYLLEDCTIRGDGGGMFGIVPRVLWEKEATPDEMNRVEIAVRCLLVLAGGKRILVDTGYGDKITPRLSRIMALDRVTSAVQQMAYLGIEPADIDIVLNTHLHADHAAGNTTISDGALVTAFPNAEYWVRDREWQDAIGANERTRATYLPDNLLPLARSGQLRLLPPGEPEIAVVPGVCCRLAPGHTPGHQMIVLGDDEVWFPADVCPYAVQLERVAWVAAYDLEPVRSMDTKRALIRQAIERQPVILFQHDPRIVAARMEGTPSHPRLTPMALDAESGSWVAPPAREGHQGKDRA